MARRADPALSAATFCIIAGAIALAFACGRPPGVQQQPGIVPPAPSEKEQKLQEQRDDLGKLNQMINQQMELERDSNAKIDDLQSQLQSAQENYAAAKAGESAELARKSDQYAAQDLQAQREDLERDLIQQRLQEDIQKQKQEIAAQSAIVAQQQNWGFDSPELNVSKDQLEEQQQNLTNLQSQSIVLREQAGQAAVFRSESKRWQEGADQQQTEQSAQAQREQAEKQIQQLTNQYNQAQAQHEKLRGTIGDLQSQYKSLQDDYQALAESP